MSQFIPLLALPHPVSPRCNVPGFTGYTATMKPIMLAHMIKQAWKSGTSSSVRRRDKARIVIIDDHALVRDGLAGLLSAHGFTIAGTADDAASGLSLIRKIKPDLAILDISLAKTDGLELIKQIKAEMPELSMLVISMHDEHIYAERVLRAGAATVR